MLTCALAFASSSGFLWAFVWGGPKRNISKAYAEHIKYLRADEEGEDDMEWGGGLGPAWHKISIC